MSRGCPMKPWPVALLERYPRDPHSGTSWPTRPWWVRNYSGGAGGEYGAIWQRTATTPDGVTYTIATWDSEHIPGDGERGGTWRTRRLTDVEIEAELAHIDRDHPLPHPGLRVGQVWARDDGEAFQVSKLDFDGTPFGYDTEGCYLVADPCCPWLAPWSPA